MSSFLISYDLISDKDYSKLYEAIRNYGSFIIINDRRIGSLTGDVTQRSFFYFNISEGDRITIDADDVHATFVPYYGS